MPLSLDELHKSARAAIESVVFGQGEAVEFGLAALFSSGHVLLEGPPGVAKTLLVRAIAATLRLECRRIQMTPDLLPGDITGSSIYREKTGTFEFVRGPVFTNFLLADEVNRASARTQSAMLEAMQELSVTHDGVTHPLPSPFVTFATQNPIEQEGTYPLPLAQLDRFMFKVQVGYPSPQAEERVLREHHATGAVTGPQASASLPSWKATTSTQPGISFARRTCGRKSSATCVAWSKPPAGTIRSLSAQPPRRSHAVDGG